MPNPYSPQAKNSIFVEQASCLLLSAHNQKIQSLWNSHLACSGRARSPTPTPHKQKIQSLWNRHLACSKKIVHRTSAFIRLDLRLKI
ncbi:hypothetical protein [Microcoleus sp. A003_D6]|uniref:hypothetical protein n=1 Tax=Microcoleus sp. A003_D6 TaxID=3055266 RepID=UPI002FD1DF86